MGYSAPRGTVDILPGQSEKWIKLEQLLRTIAANYNVKEMRTPIFEHAELFNRAVGDTSDVVSKEMYTFQDKKGRYISLRPEGTSGIARAYVENKMYGLPEKLQKVYYMGPMFRYERPQNGRQRQFHQFGVEMLGVESPYVDVECMLMAVTVVEALGLQNVTLHINSLGDNESRDAYREALKDHFRDHLDELCGDCKARFEKNPLRILDCKVDAKHPAMKTAPKTIDYLSESAKNHFDKVCTLLDDLEIDYVIDTNLVRGLDYYSHVVFEYHYYLKDGTSIGAIGAGGHYDNLVSEIGGPALSSVGFAIGIERVNTLLKELMPESLEKTSLDVYIIHMGEETLQTSFILMQELRNNCFKVDMCLENKSLGQQFKIANRKNAKFALIIGENEMKSYVYPVKNLKTTVQEEVDYHDLIDYLTNKIVFEEEEEC